MAEPKIKNIYEGRPIVLVDFDGVLHGYQSGWKGIDVIPDPPVPGALAWLSEMTVTFDVRIFSARCNEPAGIRAMIAWFKEWGLPDEVASRIQYEPGKPSAYLIVDDRAAMFCGDFAEFNVGAIQQFRPWYYDEPGYNRKR